MKCKHISRKESENMIYVKNSKNITNVGRFQQHLKIVGVKTLEELH